MKSNNPMIPIFDINLSAYLELRGITPKLQNEGPRVIFCFPNDSKTHQAMKSYNENPIVPVLDFVGHLRKLRAQMLNQRGL